MTLKISNATAIVLCDAAVDRCDAGTPPATVKIYAGTPPADADAALSGNTLLGTLTMSNPAFGAASDLNPGARATANAITDDTTADATGTATFFRVLQGGGTVLWQGSVTATGGGGDMEINAVAIVAGALIKITAMSFTHPE